MSLKLRSPAQHVQPQLTPGDGPAEAPVAEATARGVLVNYGIHRGVFPVAGMRIRDARQVLGRLLNIDGSAVCVINGNPMVDEDAVIGEDVQVLHFVKPSSIKGA
jgi:hypothetical protein